MPTRDGSRRKRWGRWGMRFSGLPIGLNELEAIARDFRGEYDKVFDIILYGSATQGKESPDDFDFILLLKDATESERFDLAFEFKEKLIGALHGPA